MMLARWVHMCVQACKSTRVGWQVRSVGSCEERGLEDDDAALNSMIVLRTTMSLRSHVCAILRSRQSSAMNI